MKQFVNTNPIALHFYSPEEQLPNDDDWKIVIVKTYDPRKMDFRIATYSDDWNEWDDDHMYHIDNDDIIAWATFSPDWVISESDRDIFGCK